MFCKPRNTLFPIIGSWVFSKITHSDGLFQTFFLLLNDGLLVLKLTVWPKYSTRSKMRETVSFVHLQGLAVGALQTGRPFSWA